MTAVTPPPLFSPLIDTTPDKDGNISGTILMPWLLFFDSLYTGDAGTGGTSNWVPAFTSLGSTGTPTFSGIYYQLSKSLTYFAVTVTPATDTTATAGTTYINNFPLKLKNDGACLAVSGFVGSSGGICQASSNRIYVPGWSAITVPVTICGIVEAG